MIGLFQRATLQDRAFAARSFDFAARLPGADLQSIFAELRIDNLSRVTTKLGQSQIMAVAMSAVAMAEETAMQPYQVQHHAAHVMAGGGVAEMATGEGKTIAVAMAASAIASTGRSVHVATANDYLAARDQRSMSGVFSRLGLTCGLIERESTDLERKIAYGCDITYGTADAFAFDYLADVLLHRERAKRPLGSTRSFDCLNDIACRRRHALVIDEIDHILIDEAITPLVLSTAAVNEGYVNPSTYCVAMQIAEQLESRIDWSIDVGSRRAVLTQRGISRSLQRIPDAALARPWTEYVRRALDVIHTLQRDVDYIVREGEIVLIDAATGRIASGRQWQDGLCQAVQQRERIPVTGEPISAAQITRWRFLRLYHQLSGCSGTAWDCRAELRSFYGLPTTRISPRLYSKRLILEPSFSANRLEKLQRIADEVNAVHSAGRPVLVGTCNVAESREVAAELLSRDLTVSLLNGVQDEDEATIVARAGLPGSITVATDMAGRGTDIRVPDDVAKIGGLHVIVTAPRHSRRLDRQLIGRCARQGQPGSARTFVAADDALLLQHGRGLSRFLESRLKPTTGVQPLWNAVTRAARRSEAEMTTARDRLTKREQRRNNFLSIADASQELTR